MDNKITAPTGWGKLKSKTHYAWIDEQVHAIRPTKDFVLYKGRWRPIEDDGIGDKFVKVPGMGIIAFFEIKMFNNG